MAEVTAFRNNALEYPVYGVPYTVVFPILDADGDPVTGATCDSEISKNGDTGADCTNEGTEITYTTATNKGMYYLTLTAAEMTADIVAITVHPDSGKATPIVLYPKKLVTLRSGTSQGGAAGYITLDASAGTDNDIWNGCLCVATIDAVVEARIIDDYDGTNEQASVTPDWVQAAPDADDTFVIYLPSGMQIPNAEVMRGTSAAATEAKQDIIDTVIDRIERKQGTVYPDTNVFYINLTNGNDSTGDGTAEKPYKSWNHVFNNSDGVGYALSPEPILVYVLAQEDADGPIDVSSDESPWLGSAIRQPNVKIVGIGYPWFDNTKASECTIAIGNAAQDAPNCEISGFRISHQSGNGIHSYSDDNKIHDIIFCGDCDAGMDIALQDCARNKVWDIRSEPDFANPGRFMIGFGGATNCSAENMTGTYAWYIASFDNSDYCTVTNCHLARLRGGGDAGAIQFDNSPTYCVALGCTLAGDIATSNVSGTGNVVSSLERQTADDALTAYAPATVAAIFAKTGLTATGTITFGEIVKMLNARAHLNFVKSGSDLLFYDDDWVSAASPGTLLFTVTVAEGSGITVVTE